jgi:tetratricopeptide (TPR) repeat protein
MRILAAFVCVLLLPGSLLAADALSLPDDPRQSISYWKVHTIGADEDPQVALAQRVFARLLRAWDSSRVEPGLYVVKTSHSAWAASLADGNILLSRDAIDISLAFGRQRGEHLLAFVLAHELAHQRSDDLWHQRFFRSLRLQDEAQRSRLLDGLPLDAGLVRDIEQMEAQADRDGLVMMASVGFDPWQVLDRQDFFTNWVESIWSLTCDQQGSTEFRNACEQARTRALRAQVQLNSVAGQAVIYELGVQAMVARNYPLARHYFTLYGREYPGRAIMSAIGISYLAEAMDLRREIDRLALNGQAGFYFPLLLDAGLDITVGGDADKRAATDIEVEALTQQLKNRVEFAVMFLQRAIRLDPDYRPLYLSIAIAHLVENNQYLVRGILQGRYIPRFGDDAAASMLLALSKSLEGDHEASIAELSALLADQAGIADQSVLSPELLSYTAAFNLARIYRFLERDDEIEPLWKSLALAAQSRGQAFLFRLALQQLDAAPQIGGGLTVAPTVKGVRLGDRKPRDDSPHRVSELWIEGEQFHVYIYQDGARYVSAASGEIISASQVGGERLLGGVIRIGEAADRPLKTLGIPDRRLQLTSGEYIAYDRYGLALKLDENRVQGWFLYP